MYRARLVSEPFGLNIVDIKAVVLTDYSYPIPMPYAGAGAARMPVTSAPIIYNNDNNQVSMSLEVTFVVEKKEDNTPQ